ncbi:hypothetical protein K7X08_018630 [Anisodus acutangulus]|uniref:Uncharacterized protein n=1 Tax=Anisodus acutangulus TaxID=402998 RepID=A0A9Q1R9Q0_9SOLA|nr:hypothetical protein K7X08_018630 [Anisodus acutangulus]
MRDTEKVKVATDCSLNGSKKKSERTDSFDARTIFGQYGSEEWGECLIREAHLSQRNLRLEIGSVAAKAYVQTPNM